jgi:hypothetical protein
LRYLKELIRASFKGTFAKNLLTDERKNLNHLLKEEKPYSERRFEFGMLSALQIMGLCPSFHIHIAMRNMFLEALISLCHIILQCLHTEIPWCEILSAVVTFFNSRR